MQTQNTLRIFFGVFCVCSVFLVAGYFLWRDSVATGFNPKESITVGNSVFEVLIAKSSEERRKGLSGRLFLERNGGMFFIFDVPGKQGIWMKDMHFPIDIVWLNKDGMVVSFQKDARPDSYPLVYKPEMEASYVLEINAGMVNASAITIGGKADLKNVLSF